MFSYNVPIALKEEIGKPELFIGRQKDMTWFLKWVDLVKDELGNSQVILARRRRGKTALVQRLFNLIYHRNDPQLIPFYFRVPEGKTTLIRYADQFFRALISQYFSFKRSEPTLLREALSYEKLCGLASDDAFILEYITDMQAAVDKNDALGAWEYARNAGHSISATNDERIIQIIDEFQYLNEYIYMDENFSVRNEIGTFYQHTASSKVSPQIITGSYIGWLKKIVDHMVGRYSKWYLDRLPAEEALACVYGYASILKRRVSDDTAGYIAEACDRDPYYIAAVFRSSYPETDLTSRQVIREILAYETDRNGDIAAMWLDYTGKAFGEVNEVNAKRLVLYLAAFDEQERTRDQIKQDLQLDMSDAELEKKLRWLAYADIIGQGQSNFRYKGLGDPIFSMVFRKIYAEEIGKVTLG